MNFIKTFITSHFKYNVSRSSANLAYYLLFSFFPVLIFLNSVLGLINVSAIEIEKYIVILPIEVQRVVSDYLTYISTSDTVVPFILGLGLTLYSFARSVNSLYYSFNEIYETNKPKLSFLTSMFFTLSLMLSVYMILVLFISGGFLVDVAQRFFTFSSEFIALFNVIRYVLPILYVFFILSLLYKVIPNKKLRFLDVLAGSVYAILGIFLISIAFSIYVKYFSNYSVVYGSLSTIMILMLWLYLASMILIQGSIINKYLQKL